MDTSRTTQKPGKVSFLRFKHLVIPPNTSTYTTYKRQHIRVAPLGIPNVSFVRFLCFFQFLFDKFLGAGAASDGSVVHIVVEYAGVGAGATLAMLTAPSGVD